LRRDAVAFRYRRAVECRRGCRGLALSAVFVTNVRRAWLGCLTLVLTAGAAEAHRLSPAYFGMTESEPELYDVQWKVSISGGLADVLAPELPAGCVVEGAVRRYVRGDVQLMHAAVVCEGSLAGREFRVAGLGSTDTDVLLRIDYADGSAFTHRLVPDRPSVVIPERPGHFDVALTYTWLGIEHILLGIDHLLFVLALLLLVNGVARLAWTITAFTLAHSITLAAATLDVVTVSPAAVEATIALSILFLATELARRNSDAAYAHASTLTARFPWIVAFTFGLLHGFGFAGALREVGLPEQAIPLALLFFNVGVELGQLMFIAAVLMLGAVLRHLGHGVPYWAPRTTAYVIGSVAAFWVFERSLSVI
ncbi:MAG: HupE/UreJ family protein, partial [Gammaproteobacteria bacterium]